MMDSGSVTDQTTGLDLFQLHIIKIMAVLALWRVDPPSNNIMVDGHPFTQATEALKAFHQNLLPTFTDCMAFMEALAICDNRAITRAALFKTSGKGKMINFDHLSMKKLSGSYGNYNHLVERFRGTHLNSYRDTLDRAIRADYVVVRAPLYFTSDPELANSCIISEPLKDLQSALDAFYKDLHDYRCNPPANDPNRDTILQWIEQKNIPDNAKQQYLERHRNRIENNVIRFLCLGLVVGGLSSGLWFFEQGPGVETAPDNEFYAELGTMTILIGAISGLVTTFILGVYVGSKYLPKYDQEADTIRGTGADLEAETAKLIPKA